jgi:hypothetical protein
MFSLDHINDASDGEYAGAILTDPIVSSSNNNGESTLCTTQKQVEGANESVQSIESNTTPALQDEDEDADAAAMPPTLTADVQERQVTSVQSNRKRVALEKLIASVKRTFYDYPPLLIVTQAPRPRSMAP